MVWDASKHSRDENVRWSWLRVVEWLGWPLFLSQPVVPVLLYFYSWPVIFVGVVVLTFIWRALVAPVWISPSLVELGVYFVRLKFVIAPAMAYLFWSQGDTPIALAALSWPLLGPLIAGWILVIPQAVLQMMGLDKAWQIGPVQIRFLLAIGLRPESEERKHRNLAQGASGAANGTEQFVKGVRAVHMFNVGGVTRPASYVAKQIHLVWVEQATKEFFNPNDLHLPKDKEHSFGLKIYLYCEAAALRVLITERQNDDRYE